MGVAWFEVVEKIKVLYLTSFNFVRSELRSDDALGFSHNTEELLLDMMPGNACNLNRCNEKLLTTTQELTVSTVERSNLSKESRERHRVAMERKPEASAEATNAPKEMRMQAEDSFEDWEGPGTDASAVPVQQRTPFTSLSQVDADMALARALQEQERAYLLFRLGSEGSDLNSSPNGSARHDYDDGEEEDEAEAEAPDNEANDGNQKCEFKGEDNVEMLHFERAAARPDGADIDGALFDSDEAFARALQEKDNREATAHLMALAGIYDFEVEYESDINDSQERIWQEVNPDNMSYEELMALGDAVGTQSKGLSAQAIANISGSTYVSNHQDNSSSDQEQCVVCRHEYEDGDQLLVLPCKHQYHSECIQQWLHANKVCPVCSAEIPFVE